MRKQEYVYLIRKTSNCLWFLLNFLRVFWCIQILNQMESENIEGKYLTKKRVRALYLGNIRSSGESFDTFLPFQSRRKNILENHFLSLQNLLKFTCSLTDS